MTPEAARRARNALVFGFASSACLWLVIGAVLWSVVNG